MSEIKTLLPTAERLDWLRLARSENVGPATFAGLLARFGSAGAALAALPRLARRAGRGRAIRIASAEDALRELEAAERQGVRLVAACEPDYPAGLAALGFAPPILAVSGQAQLLQQEAIAIVGARNASTIGMRFVRTLAEELGRAGLLVVSGLARGIDAAAHWGALPTGTAAVVAGGVDVVYPPDNRELHAEIRARGVILSEMPLGFAPLAQHFPRRNRIISGLARGVIVVEAAFQSGSLITARFAAEQGREVFAVPGSPLDPRCRGTNNLIRQGATLTESAEDVLAVLRPMLHRQFAQPASDPFGGEAPADLDERAAEGVVAAVRERLSPTPVPLDDLVRDLDLPAGVVLSALLELEIAGLAHRLPGGRVAGV